MCYSAVPANNTTAPQLTEADFSRGKPAAITDDSIGEKRDMDFTELFYHTDLDGRNIGDLRLCCCGRRLNAPDHRFGPAARDNYWLIYLKTGSGIYMVNGQTYRLHKGDIFLAFPNRRICYKADPGSIWSIYWISIACENFEKYLHLMNIDEQNPILRSESAAELENTFEALLTEIPSETLQSKFRSVSLVYKLLANLTISTLTAKRRDYIDEAIFFMTNNYDRPITTAQIAACVSLERSYFTRLFKKRTGMAPGDWLLNYRLEKAAVLLRNTDLKIKEIALSVGFEDPLYFTRRFSRLFGVSPTVWRNTKTSTENA